MRLDARTIALLIGLAAGVILASAIGCGPSYKPIPYMPKAALAPKPLACHDGIGHVAGNKPWILGGTCCCTPTPENFAMHVAQGTIDKTMTYDQYRALYKQRNIMTDLDHKGCGNVCPCGPHVLLGGRCMATPTPGTYMYERVTYGPHAPLVLGDGDVRPVEMMIPGQRTRY